MNAVVTACTRLRVEPHRHRLTIAFFVRELAFSAWCDTILNGFGHNRIMSELAA